MKNFLLRILISSIAVLLVSAVLSGIHVDGFVNALIVAGVLAILNALLKPILVILTIPATILSLGLFLIVINTVIVLVADWMVDAIVVEGFWWAMLFSVLLSIVNSVFFGMIKD